MDGVDVLIPVYKPNKEFSILLEKLLEQTVPPRHIYLLHTVDGDALGAGLINDGVLSDGVPNDSVLSDGVPDDGVPNDSVLSDGVPDDGVLSDGALDYDLSGVNASVISVHPVKKSEFDHGGTRRFGADMSEGEFMLFMTQDAAPFDDKLIENLLAAFDDEKTAIAYARQLARDGADEIEEMTRIYNYPAGSMVKTKDDLKRLGIKTYFCSDVCAMYRKSVYDKLGGFVERAIFNEDMIMAANAINAGYSVAYRADAKVIHSHSYTCMQQFHRNFDLGVSQGQHPEIFADISSEKEGAGYAGMIVKTLLKKGKIIKAFYFCMQCGFKLIGYKMGKNYKRLPRRVVGWCTMSQGYWERS